MRWLALLCAWWALALPVVAEGANRAQFNELLAEAEMQFEPPAGATSLASSANAVMNYERALRTADGLLEIRYAIRPLKRLRIDYDDPHGAAPDPNHIFPLMFEALAVRLSGGTHTPTQEYPQDRAQSEFNADWAAAAVFDVKSDFATD